MEEKRLIRAMKGKTLKKLFVTLFIIYISYLLYLTLLSSYYGRGTHHRSINMVPFKTIIQYIYSDDLRGTITNILGNIAAFIPLGLILPIITQKLKRIICIIPILLFTTVSIEFMQFILGVGASDIDDIILNILGGIIGFLFYQIFFVMTGLIEGI